MSAHDAAGSLAADAAGAIAILPNSFWFKTQTLYLHPFLLYYQQLRPMSATGADGAIPLTLLQLLCSANNDVAVCNVLSFLSQALGPRAVLVLSTVILPTALQPGHDLCQQGAPADRLWFLTEGVCVTRGP